MSLSELSAATTSSCFSARSRSPAQQSSSNKKVLLTRSVGSARRSAPIWAMAAERSPASRSCLTVISASQPVHKAARQAFRLRREPGDEYDPNSQHGCRGTHQKPPVHLALSRPNQYLCLEPLLLTHRLRQPRNKAQRYADLIQLKVGPQVGHRIISAGVPGNVSDLNSGFTQRKLGLMLLGGGVIQQDIMRNPVVEKTLARIPRHE